MREEEFINIFNENYPFERYILKKPVQITSIFDDLLLTEIFVPETKIKPIVDDNGHFIKWSEMPWNEIYVKVKPKWHHQSMRLSFYDFAEQVRDEIEWAVIKDFGQYEWECLYIEFDDPSEKELLQALQIQYNLIKLSYGECKIKDISCTDTLKICEKLCG